MSGISVQDYEPGMAVELEDPTDPVEEVEKSLMNRLAVLLTRLEELLNAGDAEMTISQLSGFIELRGDLLDELDDPEIRTWLQKMRESSRAPHRRYTLG